MLGVGFCQQIYWAPCVTWSLELMSNIAGVEFVGNNIRGRNFCWVKCAKTLTSVVNTNLKVGRSKEFKVIQKIFTAS